MILGQVIETWGHGYRMVAAFAGQKMLGGLRMRLTSCAMRPRFPVNCDKVCASLRVFGFSAKSRMTKHPSAPSTLLCLVPS